MNRWMFRTEAIGLALLATLLSAFGCVLLTITMVPGSETIPIALSAVVLLGGCVYWYRLTRCDRLGFRIYAIAGILVFLAIVVWLLS